MATRTYGLSGSGMDVDAMVKQLMTARRIPVTQMTQKVTQLEWKKAAYNDLYSQISTLRNTVFNYKMQSSLSAKTASTSNSSAVTVSANADAVTMNHSITVKQLAQGINKASDQSITTGTSKSTLVDQFGIASDSFNISIADGTKTATIAVDPTKSIYEMVSSINKAGLNVQANYDATLDRFFLYSKSTGSAVKIDLSGSDTAGLDFMKNNLRIGTGATQIGSSAAVTTGTSYVSGSPPTLSQQFTGLSGSFDIKVANGTSTATVSIDTSTDTMDSLVSKLSSAGVNVSASYDASLDRFVVQTTNSGSAAGIDFSSSDASALTFLQSNLKMDTTALAQHGKDAVVNVDGVNNLAQASNSFSVSGVTYTLQALGSANVNVTSDVDKTVSNVKAFVDAYNTALDKINAKLDEKAYRDYLPLTDDAKSSMKDADITAWEAKAHSGMLRHDSILTNLVSTMRSALMSPVSGITGDYNSAASLGITTGAWTENGHLYLDESKLKQALTADPEAVSKVFGTNGDSSASDGIAVRLYDSLKASMDKIVQQAGTSSDADTKSSLGREINDYTKHITSMNDRLEDVETQYYTQFDAMETYIQRMNQQSAWLTQQFSSGSS